MLIKELLQLLEATNFHCSHCGEDLGKDTQLGKTVYCGNCGETSHNAHGSNHKETPKQSAELGKMSRVKINLPGHKFNGQTGTIITPHVEKDHHGVQMDSASVTAPLEKVHKDHLVKSSGVETEGVRQSYSADLSDSDYQALRKAKMHGDFSHVFTAVETAKGHNSVTFKTSNIKKLATDLEKIVDSGETSWMEIFNTSISEAKKPVSKKSPFKKGTKIEVVANYTAGQGKAFVGMKGIVRSDKLEYGHVIVRLNGYTEDMSFDPSELERE